MSELRLKAPRTTPPKSMTRSQRHMLRDLGHRDTFTVPLDDVVRNPEGAQARVLAWVTAWQYVHGCSGAVGRTDDHERAVATFRMYDL